MRVSAVWPIWLAAIMPASAMARRRVAAHVAAQLGLEHEFIDIDNPA